MDDAAGNFLLRSMLNTLISNWALFAGIGLITMGSGLQGTLIGVRAGIEGFSILATGVVMSCYYGGFFLGSKLAPKLVSRVGHIRAFVAFTSLASATVLLHAVFLTPVIWGMIRVVTGFAYMLAFASVAVSRARQSGSRTSSSRRRRQTRR